MARYPAATWKPIGAGGTVAMARYDLLVIHTMVGNLVGTDNYFRQQPNNSHFGVGGKWGADVAGRLDGTVYQWVDTRYRSAATREGNPRVIAVECADNAPASPADIAPFTPAQCDALVALMVWANATHGIPLVAAHDSRSGTVGIGYHRLGCDPYRIVDGELWSSAYGKVCPGDARIGQIPGLIARAQAIVAGPPEGPFMALTDAEQDEVLRGARSASHTDLMLSQNNTAGDVNSIVVSEQQQAAAIAALTQGQKELSDKLDQVLAAVTPKPDPGPAA